MSRYGVANGEVGWKGQNFSPKLAEESVEAAQGNQLTVYIIRMLDQE